MIEYMKKTFVNIIILLVVNIGTVLLCQFLYSIFFDVNVDDGVSVFAGLLDILLFTGYIYYSIIWCIISFVPELIGFLLCRKDGTKMKTFIGFTTATFVMFCIYVAFWTYLEITLIIHIPKSWYILIPLVVCIFILVRTMMKTYSGYKNISTNAYIAPNAYSPNNYSGNNYQGNQNNYGYNMNYNQSYTPSTNGSEYQTGQQFINPNNNYYG